MGTRIKDLFSTTAAPAADDYAVLDGAGSGTRKILATALGATGGATPSASVTLTALSPAVQVMTPPGFGCAFTLPDAGTCTRKTPIFHLTNAGDFDVLIKNSAGTIKGFIRPQSSAIVGLADNSTAAGMWAISGAREFGHSAGVDCANLTLVNGMGGSSAGYHDIDADRQMLLFGGSTVLYAVVYNRTTNTWGPLATVRTNVSSIQFTGCYVGSDKFLVVSAASTSGEAVILSLSGTAITVNAATTFTEVSGASYQTNNWVTLGSAFILTHVTGAIHFRAFTVSGTTPTVGADNDPTSGGGGGHPMGFAEGSNFCVFYYYSGAINFKLYTLSGTTFTAGTPATFAADRPDFRVIRLTTGRWMVFSTDSIAGLRGTLVYVSGTTLNVSSAALDASMNGLNLGGGWLDGVLVPGSTTKVALAWNPTNGGTAKFAIFYDNANTATAGAVASLIAQNAPDMFLAVADGTTDVRFVVGSSDLLFVKCDCSTTTLAVSTITRLARAATNGSLSMNNTLTRTLRGDPYQSLLLTSAGIAYYVANTPDRLAGLKVVRVGKTVSLVDNDLSMTAAPITFIEGGTRTQLRSDTSAYYHWWVGGHGSFATFRKLELAQ